MQEAGGKREERHRPWTRMWQGLETMGGCRTGDWGEEGRVLGEEPAAAHWGHCKMLTAFRTERAPPAQASETPVSNL